MRRILANPIVLYLLASVVLILVFNHFFIHKPGGLSAAELDTKNSSLSLSVIFHHPLSAPHHLVAFGLHSAGVGWQSAIRLSSLIFAVIFLTCFFYVLRPLFGLSIGWMGLLLLLSTPLFLVGAREGSAAIMFFWTIPLMAAYGAAIRSTRASVLILLSPVIALGFYIPGVILWVVGAAILCRKKVAALFSENDPPAVTAAVLIGILLLVPLGWAAQDLTVLKQLLLIPAHWPTPLTVLKNIAWMLSALFIKSPLNSPLILGNLPIFNIVGDALLIFGGFAMWGAARGKLAVLALSLAYAVVAAGIDYNTVLLGLGVPSALIIMSAGLRYLFIEWRRIFPRNPLAKTLALSLMWIIIAVQLAFGVRYALIAWPAANATKAAYMLK